MHSETGRKGAGRKGKACSLLSSGSQADSSIVLCFFFAGVVLLMLTERAISDRKQHSPYTHKNIQTHTLTQ